MHISVILALRRWRQEGRGQSHRPRSSELEASLSHIKLSRTNQDWGHSLASRVLANTMETKTRGSEVEDNPQTTQQVRSQTGLQEAVFKKRQEKNIKSKFLELFFLFCYHTTVLFRAPLCYTLLCLWCHRCSQFSTSLKTNLELRIILWEKFSCSSEFIFYFSR